MANQKDDGCIEDSPIVMSQRFSVSQTRYNSILPRNEERSTTCYTHPYSEAIHRQAGIRTHEHQHRLTQSATTFYTSPHPSRPRTNIVVAELYINSACFWTNWHRVSRCDPYESPLPPPSMPSTTTTSSSSSPRSTTPARKTNLGFSLTHNQSPPGSC